MTITALNGRIPDALLVVVDTGANGPQKLLATVAPIWAAMLAAGMPAGCLTSGYRTLDQQRVEVARATAGLTPLAAPVGQSMHGEGLAADLAEPARSWARAHAGVYGLRFTLASEPWHTELDQAHLPDGTTTPQEDDMPWFFSAANGEISIVGPQGPKALSPAEWQTWYNLGFRVDPRFGGMQPGPYAALWSSLTPDSAAQIAAAVVAQLQPQLGSGAGLTAGQVADELAKRLAS